MAISQFDGTRQIKAGSIDLTTEVKNTLPVPNGGTGTTTSTGSGSNVQAISPTLTTPVLGVATATSVVASSNITIGASLGTSQFDITSIIADIAGGTTKTINIAPTISGALASAQTNHYGLYHVPTFNLTGASATITNTYGKYVGATLSAGTITNWYGTYIANPTGAGTFTTKYALVTESGSGNVGFGVTAPTAFVQIKAGVATASNAPLKLTSGTNLTTAEAGAEEYDGTSRYFTPGTTRKRYRLIANGSNATSGASATVDWSSFSDYKLTLTANCTLTFTSPGLDGDMQKFTLTLVQDATGSRTVTFPASVIWAGASTPTLTTTATYIDIITFQWDNTAAKYRATPTLNFSA